MQREREHALEEVKKLFPRQIKVNAIDVFITTHRKSHQKFVYGNEVHLDTFSLITPGNAHYSDRQFSGSELSLVVCEGFNKKYGLIALIAQMSQKTKNRSVGREIVRAFTKHAICITSKYLSEYAEGSRLSKDNIVFQKKDAFYVALFDSSAIRSQMRGHSKDAKTQRHMKKKGRNASICINPSFSSNDFVTLCNENSLEALGPIIHEVLTLEDCVQRDHAFLNIGRVFQLFSRSTNNSFYKRLNKVFEA